VGRSEAFKLGIGIGLGVGLPVVLALIFGGWWWLDRRRSKRARQTSQEGSAPVEAPSVAESKDPSVAGN